MNRISRLIPMLILVWQLPSGRLRAQVTIEYFQGGNYYILHSDSDNPITGSDEFLFSRDHKLVLSIPVSDERRLILGIGTTGMTMQRHSISIDEPSTIYDPTLSLIHRIYPVDIGFLRSSVPWAGYGLAASIIGYSRTTYYKAYSQFLQSDYVVRDRLMGYGLGANIIVHGSIIAGSRLALLMSIELRYGRMLWFDTRGRDLSNFDLEFLYVQGSFGLGFRPGSS